MKTSTNRTTLIVALALLGGYYFYRRRGGTLNSLFDDFAGLFGEARARLGEMAPSSVDEGVQAVRDTARNVAKSV